VTVIGPRWLTATDPSGRRRIDQPSDYHRIEIGRALQRRIRIIPTLVGGARMPSETELPESLRDLARRNAVEVSDKRFNYDTEILADAVERVVSRAELAAEVQAQARAKQLDAGRKTEAAADMQIREEPPSVEKTSEREQQAVGDAGRNTSIAFIGTLRAQPRLLKWLLGIMIAAIAVAFFVRPVQQREGAQPVKADASTAVDQTADQPKSLPKPSTVVVDDARAPTPATESTTVPAEPSTAKSGAGDHVGKVGRVRESQPATSGAKRSSRCSDLLSRLQLGEVLSAEDQALFQKECRR
jgi:hypothetical protein